jgi:hypothetical protein
MGCGFLALADVKARPPVPPPLVAHAAQLERPIPHLPMSDPNYKPPVVPGRLLRAGA